MTKLRAHSIAVSIDGFMAGPRQSEDDPMGVGGHGLHQWAFATAAFNSGHGGDAGGTTGVDNDFIKRGEAGVGATLMGRNMFGPVRGEWPDLSWRGWWGEEPPYHHPVVVLTHHPREPLEMTGTTFYFCTDGLAAGVARAKELAGDLDVRVGGGASTIRQLLATGELDSLHLAIAPVLLGDGERVFDDLTAINDAYTVSEVVPGEGATHVTITKR